MKITLEPYCGGVYTSTQEAEHISVTVNQFKGLLVAAGYHPETVDGYFNEEAWFPEDELGLNTSEESDN